MSEVKQVKIKLTKANKNRAIGTTINAYVHPKSAGFFTNPTLPIGKVFGNIVPNGESSNVAIESSASKYTVNKRHVGRGYNSASSSSSSSSSGISGVAGSSSTVGIKTLGGAGGVSSSNPKKRIFGRFNEDEEENEHLHEIPSQTTEPYGKYPGSLPPSRNNNEELTSLNSNTQIKLSQCVNETFDKIPECVAKILYDLKTNGKLKNDIIIEIIQIVGEMLNKEEQKIRSSKQELQKIFTKYKLSLKTNQEIISMLNEPNYKNLVKGKNLNRNAMISLLSYNGDEKWNINAQQYKKFLSNRVNNAIRNTTGRKSVHENYDGNIGEEVIMFQPRNKRTNNLTRQQQELNATAALASQQQQNASASSTSARNTARMAFLSKKPASYSEEENESEDEKSEEPVSSSSNKNKPINKPAFNANFNTIRDKYFIGKNGKKYRITSETKSERGKRARTALKIDGEIITKSNYEKL